MPGGRPVGSTINTTFITNCNTHGLTLHSKQRNGLRKSAEGRVTQMYRSRCLECDRERHAEKGNA